MSKSSKILRSVAVLAMGILLTVGGLYIWSNQFDINLFSNAGTARIRHIVILGDSMTSDNADFGHQIKTQLEDEYGSSLTYTEGYSETVTLPLKDQLISAYQSLPQPVEGKVLFIVMTGQSEISRGIEKRSSPASIASDIEKELRDMISLPQNRPGVFPDGASFYIADIYDPTDGIFSISTCRDLYPYETKAEADAVFSEIDSALDATAVTYSDKATIVPVREAFVGHAAGAASADLRWLTNCTELTTTGNEELAKIFVESITKNEK